MRMMYGPGFAGSPYSMKTRIPYGIVLPAFCHLMSGSLVSAGITTFMPVALSAAMLPEPVNSPSASAIDGSARDLIFASMFSIPFGQAQSGRRLEARPADRLKKELGMVSRRPCVQIGMHL